MKSPQPWWAQILGLIFLLAMGLIWFVGFWTTIVWAVHSFAK